jgi:hypothetical protein
MIKKMMLGGLLTAGIKTAIKKLGKKTINLERDLIAKDLKHHRRAGYKDYKKKDIPKLVRESHRLQAKEDMRQGIKIHLKDKRDKAKIRASSQKSMAPAMRNMIKQLNSAAKYKKKLN